MNEIMIKNRKIGEGHKPFIIAEAGINHNGSTDIAKEMIKMAKEAGADAVKFQTFTAEEFVQDRKLMYTYISQGNTVTEPIIDVFKRSELSKDEWKELKIFCDDNNILFISTPGNISDMELLMSIGVSALKVGSDDFVNIPLIRRFKAEKVPLLLSCGMAEEDEIELTLQTAGAFSGKEIALFLCTSQYPTPAKDVNILRLRTLRKKYPNLVLGLSDHSKGSTAAIMAICYGARIFEKHFTLDKSLAGPDHWFSDTPDELGKWIRDINEANEMLGYSELRPTLDEEKNRREYQRSITTLDVIKKGELYTVDNLCMRRPGSGLTGKMWDEVIGKRATRDINKNVQLCRRDYE